MAFLNDSYTNPKGIDYSSLHGATKKDAKKSFAMPTAAGGHKTVEADKPGFNKDLKKRIKNSDNIAQETRLKIKLGKKEQRQEGRAQNKLDRNPGYIKNAAEKNADSNAKNAMLQLVTNPYSRSNSLINTQRKK